MLVMINIQSLRQKQDTIRTEALALCERISCDPTAEKCETYRQNIEKIRKESYRIIGAYCCYMSLTSSESREINHSKFWDEIAKMEKMIEFCIRNYEKFYTEEKIVNSKSLSRRQADLLAEIERLDQQLSDGNAGQNYIAHLCKIEYINVALLYLKEDLHRCQSQDNAGKYFDKLFYMEFMVDKLAQLILQSNI